MEYTDLLVHLILTSVCLFPVFNVKPSHYQKANCSLWYSYVISSKEQVEEDDSCEKMTGLGRNRREKEGKTLEEF